jgi:hypothetical protein
MIQPWQMNEMKAKKEGLVAAAQCEQLRSLFNNCIQHFCICLKTILICN